MKTRGSGVKKGSLSTPLILLGVFKGYLDHPGLFLLRSRLSFPGYKKTIPGNFPEELIDSAGFLAWLYIRLKKKVRPELAFELIRAAVLTTGVAVQQDQFDCGRKPRSFENLIRNQQKTNREGSTKLNNLRILEQNEDRYHFQVTHCIFHELFSSLGVPELTSVYCSIDNAVFGSYLPELLVFHRRGRNHTMAQGHPFCEFVIEKREI